MRIFNFLFGPKNQPKGISKESSDENVPSNIIQNIEIVENKISIEEKAFGENIIFQTHQGHNVSAREFFLESFDMKYKQFIIQQDNIIGYLKCDSNYGHNDECKIRLVANTKGPLPPFLPFREQAIEYFYNIWPQSNKIKCYYCHAEKTFPIDIIKMQKLIIFMQIPYKKEIVGWRVSEVNSFVGTGSPVDYAEGWGGNKQYLWQSITDKKITC
jgi:hypothetical protein